MDYVYFFYRSYDQRRDLHSFPTRRSSDLVSDSATRVSVMAFPKAPLLNSWKSKKFSSGALDRKSTRLNSSHSQISYAVFCLKKKNVNPHGFEPQRVLQPNSTTADVAKLTV